MELLLREIRVRKASRCNTSYAAEDSRLGRLPPKMKYLCKQTCASILFYSTYYPTVEFALRIHYGVVKSRVCPATIYQSQQKGILTYLGDAQPDVLVRLRVAEAEPQLLGFVGVDVEPFEVARLAAGIDCVNFLSVAEHVQAPGSLGTPVEGD